MKQVEDPASMYAALVTRTTDPFSITSCLGALPNPDRVLRKLGKSEEVYDDLLVDAHVASVVQSRKGAVLAAEWEVRPASSKRKDKLAADMCRAALNRLDVWQLIEWIADAPLRGRAYVEVVWEYEDGLVVPKRIHQRPTRRFVYADADETELRLLTRDKPIIGGPVPPMKILEARKSPTDDNPYGVAALSSCYWPHRFKHGGWRFWVIFAEKYGMPLLVGKLRRGASKEEQIAFDAALEAIVQDGILRIPDGASVEVVTNAGTASTSVYSALTDAANAEISKAILGQTLTTEVKEGSLAAARVHDDVRQDIIEGDKKLVRATINEFLRWVVELNMDEASPPQFGFCEDEVVPQVWADFFKGAVAAKIPIPVSYVLAKTGIPSREGDEPMVGEVATETPVDREFAERNRDDAQDALDALVRRTLGSWADTFDGWRRSIDAVLDGAETLPADVSDLWGRLSASTETLSWSRFAARINGMLSVESETADFAAEFLFEALPFEEAIAFAKKRIPLTDAEWAKLADADRAAAFTIAGVAKLDLLSELQEALNKALTDGSTLRDFQKTANEVLTKSGMDPLSSFQAETIFRNSVQTAYAVGRHEQMSRPAVLARRPIWVYDAIDDDSTRPAHRAMDQKAFRADDPIWATWYPPNGHRCRCSVYSLSEREASRRGIIVERGSEFLARPHEIDGKTVNVVPDAGFATNPAAASFVPDLRKRPGGLVQAAVREIMATTTPATAAERLIEFGVADVQTLGRVVRGSGPLIRRWATDKQREEDIAKVIDLGYNPVEAEELLDQATAAILENPSDVLVYHYKPRGTVQYLFRRSKFGRLRNVGVVYDPGEDRIQGVHGDYTDKSVQANKNWSETRTVKLNGKR